MKPGAYPLALAGITLVGCVLRLLFLTDGSVWLDEVYTMERSGAPLGEMFRPSSYDANPPFPYLLYKGWVSLFGRSEWSWELPAAIVGVAAIVATAGLGRRLFDPGTGLVGALLVAVSVEPVDASQQIRGYALGVLLSVLAVHALCVVLDRGSRTAAAVLVLTSAMLIYSHYAALFVVVSLLLFGVLYAWKRRREALRTVLVACLLIGLGFAPRLFDLYAQYTDLASFQWIPSPSPGQALDVLLMFNSHSWIYFVCALTVAAGAAWSRRSALFPARSTVLFLWLVIPVGAVLVLSLVGRPFFIYRYFVFAVPAYALILARCSSALPRAWLKAAAVGVLLAASVLPLRTYYSERLETQGREVAARFVAERFEQGDVILHTAFVEFLPTWIFYHERRFPEYLMAEAAWDELSPFWPEKGIVQSKSVAEDHDRIWMICDSRTIVTQGHGIFADHHLDFFHVAKRSTVFLFQRCPTPGCDGSRAPRAFPAE